MFSAVELQGFYCTVTDDSGASTTLLESLLRPVLAADAALAALPRKPAVVAGSELSVSGCRGLFPSRG